MSDQDLESRARIKREASEAEAATRLGLRAQTEEVTKRKFNPEFLSQLQDSLVDTEVFDWLSNEIGPPLSGGHILGNREEDFERRQDLLNANKAERMVAERSPGRLLRRYPEVLALWQGIDEPPVGSRTLTDHPDFVAPISKQRERRAIRDAMEVATTKQTLAIDGKGIDSVTAATTENRSVESRDEEANGALRRLKGVFS